jgi:hypothetical protein
MATQQELDAQAALTAGDEAARQRQIADARARTLAMQKKRETSGLPATTETGEPTVSDMKGTTGFALRDTSEQERLRTSYTSAVDEEGIRAAEQAHIQEQIEAIQRQAAVERAKLAGEAQQRTGRTRATSARAGLAGSTFGEAQAQQTGIFNQQQREAFEAQVATQIAVAKGNASQRAVDEIAAQRELKSQDYGRFLEERSRIQTAAREDIAGIGAQGGTLDDLDSATKDMLLKQSGMSEFAANTVALSNSPEANATYQVKGDKIFGWYRDPKTGTIKTVESESIPGLSGDEDFDLINGVPYLLTRDENGNITKGDVMPGFKQEDVFKFQKGTKTQQAGWFNETTGEFTPLSEGTPAGAPSSPDNNNTLEDPDITFDEWLDALQEQEQTTYNIADTNINSALQEAYENQTGNKASQIKLSSTQYNKGLLNYKSSVGGTETLFNRLSPAEKLDWSKGKVEPNSSVAPKTSEPAADLGEYSFN